ncbi:MULTISPECIES: sugar ABC transporter substrate-binding protein [unclassified Cryobacterium]|uniref:ABC transporter substrate-binding protein n=1 Tax=unclassified Cryobacterium TaxID=2649013 RepID=UPI00106B2AD3|nr:MULTISPECIES: sugar ABC transporter substrate-binding protein [unclassified Cryobacterium]TFD04633.1 sugar ABC transporter substrate-binding protein [Cryobacterium sp. TMT1-66-1]TFD08418.1 sugar ABC transporter substrate-binding protein [Cryobacterium sp. TMT1-2-2]
MKRHSVVRVAAIVAATFFAAGTLTACSAGAGDDGGSKTLRVTLANHVWTDTIKSKLPEFEAATGLTVELSQYGEDQLSDQYNVKLNAGTDEIDVMMYRPLQEGKLFAKNGYLADLTDNVESNADWNWSDFQSGPVESTTYDGNVVGVPIITEQEVLYYRKDLLAKAGLEVPTTMDELEAAAKAIKEQNPGVAGFVARTGKSAAVTQFSSFLYSFGGDFIDEDGNSAIASPEAKEAYAFYGGLIRDYGPENVSTDMSWPEAMAIFTQGQAGLYTEADSLYKNATDPETSKVSDTVGFAPMPAGPGGSAAYNVPSWALGVNAESAYTDEAWSFIEWATSADLTLEVQQDGVPGARQSVWEDPEGTSTYPADLAAAIATSTKNGVGHDRPLVIKVPEAREIVGDPIVIAITGGDSDAAADAASEAFQGILDDE